MCVFFSLPANAASCSLPPVAGALLATIGEVNPKRIILFDVYPYGNLTPCSDADLFQTQIGLVANV